MKHDENCPGCAPSTGFVRDCTDWCIYCNQEIQSIDHTHKIDGKSYCGRCADELYGQRTLSEMTEAESAALTEKIHAAIEPILPPGVMNGKCAFMMILAGLPEVVGPGIEFQTKVLGNLPPFIGVMLMDDSVTKLRKHIEKESAEVAKQFDGAVKEQT